MAPSSQSSAPPEPKRRPSTEAGQVSPPRKRLKASAAISEAAVRQFFTPASQKTQTVSAWKEYHGTLLVTTHKEDEYQAKLSKTVGAVCSVFAFDLDSTLIKSKSGRAFPQDAQDWQWWHSSVPGRLRSLHEQGHQIVIFTNQGWTDKQQKAVRDFKARTRTVLENLDIPIALYAARARDQFRKPQTGMWITYLKGSFADDRSRIDLAGSKFVGDMAGRVSKNGTLKDRSCSDRDFAANIGITFATPEEFFLGLEPMSWRRAFDPTGYMSIQSESVAPQGSAFCEPASPEILMFCGSPGAGKSTFFTKQLAPLGYKRVNQDILKTRDNCVKAAKGLLGEDQSVAVDNTNANIETRKHWIGLANAHSVPIRCVYFSASTELAKHNAAVRTLGGPTLNPEGRTALPDIAFMDYKKRFQKPQLEEGFKEIIEIAFEFSGDAEQVKAWSQHY